MVCGGRAFLLEFLGFWVCFVMVNRGEFVVERVANVVRRRSLFRDLKIGQLFEFYFCAGNWPGRTRAARYKFSRPAPRLSEDV